MAEVCIQPQVVLVSTQFRLEKGPTIVGDGDSDIVLMDALGAVSQPQMGSKCVSFEVAAPPRVVLNKLLKVGFEILSQGAAGQTMVWTCYIREPFPASRFFGSN